MNNPLIKTYLSEIDLRVTEFRRELLEDEINRDAIFGYVSHLYALAQAVQVEMGGTVMKSAPAPSKPSSESKWVMAVLHDPFNEKEALAIKHIAGFLALTTIEKDLQSLRTKIQSIIDLVATDQYLSDRHGVIKIGFKAFYSIIHSRVELLYGDGTCVAKIEVKEVAQ